MLEMLDFTSLYSNASLEFCLSRQCRKCYNFQSFGEYIEIFCKKSSFSLHLVEMDIDLDPDPAPDRQAPDADPGYGSGSGKIIPI
jgi:hypothetical protein